MIESLSLGTDGDIIGSSSSSSSPSASAPAVRGGLIASGEGPCASKPEAPGALSVLEPAPGVKRVLPAPNAVVSVGDVALAGGLDAEAAGVRGGAPELNSAQRGHFRFVSAQGGTRISRRVLSRDEGQADSTYSCAPSDRSDRIVSEERKNVR